MTIVFTNGCFDIIHRGHVELLKYARSIGDHLVVGINSDESVRKNKGKDRPINSEHDRYAILESFRFVDDVVIFKEDTPINLIKQIKPDIIVKGGDYLKEDVVGFDFCEVRIFDYLDGYSTTKIIEDTFNR
jgi:D-beta-D-heptose 7-phosphate kinase/D-beta-D-heptose 1-phosphate adenosyltransferase